jgi:hypothetical protein
MSYEDFEDEKRFEPFNKEQETIIIYMIVENLKSADIYYLINEIKIIEVLTHLRKMGYEAEVYNILLPQIQNFIDNFYSVEISKAVLNSGHIITIRASVIEDFINTPIEVDPSASISGLLILLEHLTARPWVDLDEFVNSCREIKIKIKTLHEMILARIAECKMKI